LNRIDLKDAFAIDHAAWARRDGWVVSVDRAGDARNGSITFYSHFFNDGVSPRTLNFRTLFLLHEIRHLTGVPHPDTGNEEFDFAANTAYTNDIATACGLPRQ
jgi:hypothetical protein